MPLFHPRVLKRELENAVDIPDPHQTILDAWCRNLAAGNYDSETQNDSEFIQRILIDVLGFVGSSAGDKWTVAKNQPVGSGNVDVALGNFSVSREPEILAPFELKGARTKDLDAVMPGRHKSPVQQAWEYAMDAKGAKWVLVSNYREIRLYAVGYGRKDYEAFDLATMTTSDNYNRFVLLLSAENLLSGATLKLLKDSEAAEKEITAKLYAEYKETRALLINGIMDGDNCIKPLKAVELAQTILDRVLFIAFAEDKGLLKKETLKDAYNTKNQYSPQPAWDNFKGLFKAIDKGNERLNIPGYNGGLFASDVNIETLELSEEICARFRDLGDYDFSSEVSVNILGHVFEQSIADIEDIKKQLDPASGPPEEVGSKRRTDGIFYTPAFVTRHIVEQAVGSWLSDRKTELGFNTIEPLTDADYASIKLVGRRRGQNKLEYNANVQKHIDLWEAYRDRLSKIRVLDPACGSGAFLNEVFDFLYREGQTINRTLETFYGGQISLFKWDTHILANNLFGVDINRESVEITKLSLWLKTANRNEKLSYLDDNIKTGNSLIDDKTIAGNLAFDWTKVFAAARKNGGFDVVVGNPPYVDSEAMTRAWAREREYITRTFQQTTGNWDLYVAFLELGLNLLSDTGYLSFITPDKWISKDFGTAMRKRIVPGIVSILPVGRGVFESALVDSIITTISNQEVDRLQILSLDGGEVQVAAEIDKDELDGEEGFDQLLSSHYLFLRKMEGLDARRLGDISPAENACATSDTYVLGEILEDAGSAHGYIPSKHYKIANTGTLSRYAFRWGSKPMRYLKADYVRPVVKKSQFRANLGATYQRRAASSKIIIKGLTLLDGALDLDGSFVPGKSTLVVCNDDPTTLKMLAGIINSKVASFYVKQKYASASYNGGVNFTVDMLNSIPVPKKLDVKSIVKNVDAMIIAQEEISKASRTVQAALHASGAPDKLRRALYTWYALSTAEFIQEVELQGITMSIKQKAQWAEIFEKNKALVAQNLVDLAAADSAIDTAMFAAFNLTKAEQKLIAES